MAGRNGRQYLESSDSDEDFDINGSTITSSSSSSDEDSVEIEARNKKPKKVKKTRAQKKRTQKKRALRRKRRNANSSAANERTFNSDVSVAAPSEHGGLSSESRSSNLLPDLSAPVPDERVAEQRAELYNQLIQPYLMYLRERGEIANLPVASSYNCSSAEHSSNPNSDSAIEEMPTAFRGVLNAQPHSSANIGGAHAEEPSSADMDYEMENPANPPVSGHLNAEPSSSASAQHAIAEPAARNAVVARVIILRPEQILQTLDDEGQDDLNDVLRFGLDEFEDDPDVELDEEEEQRLILEFEQARILQDLAEAEDAHRMELDSDPEEVAELEGQPQPEELLEPEDPLQAAPVPELYVRLDTAEDIEEALRALNEEEDTPEIVALRARATTDHRAGGDGLHVVLDEPHTVAILAINPNADEENVEGNEEL